MKETEKNIAPIDQDELQRMDETNRPWVMAWHKAVFEKKEK